MSEKFKIVLLKIAANQRLLPNPAGEDMAEDALEGETRRREEAEARLGLTTEALERAANESKWRDAEEALRKAEEEYQSEVQRLA